MAVLFDSLMIIAAVTEMMVKQSTSNAKSYVSAGMKASPSLLLGGLALKHILSGGWLAD